MLGAQGQCQQPIELIIKTVLRLLHRFAADHADFVVRLDALLASDSNQAIAQVHTLKGLSSNLGLMALAESARQFELAMNVGRDETARQRLVQSLDETIDTLHRVLPTPESPLPSQEVDRNALRSLLEQLLPYLEKQRLIPDGLMETLRQQSGEEIARLVDAIDHFDFAAARKLTVALQRQEWAA